VFLQCRVVAVPSRARSQGGCVRVWHVTSRFDFAGRARYRRDRSCGDNDFTQAQITPGAVGKGRDHEAAPGTVGARSQCCKGQGSCTAPYSSSKTRQASGSCVFESAFKTFAAGAVQSPLILNRAGEVLPAPVNPRIVPTSHSV